MESKSLMLTSGEMVDQASAVGAVVVPVVTTVHTLTSAVKVVPRVAVVVPVVTLPSSVMTMPKLNLGKIR